MTTTLSTRLRNLRTRQRLTQAQLAHLAGVRRATISDWESGKVHAMDFATFTRVCNALGVAPSDLMLLPHRTSKRATKAWEAADDLTPPETVEETFALYERHAQRWLKVLSAHERRDTATDAGWGALPKASRKQDARDLAEAERSGAEGYIDQLLLEVELARRAITALDARAATLHALRAGHSHGAARALMSQYERPKRR